MVNELLNYVPAAGLLQDKVIVVTGAASGVGRSVAKAYARFGATVVLLDKNVPRLEALYDQLVEAGYPEPAIFPVDLQTANQDTYQTLADTVQEQLGRLDGLVLNAAWLAAYMPMKNHDVDLWVNMMTVNLHANFLIVRTCMPLLEQSPDPAIIFSSDVSNKPYQGAYGVSKAALDSFCDILASELDGPPHFVRVNRINTGPLLTPLRTLHYPGENPASLASPNAIVGPYLYFMGADAGKRTGEAIDLGRLAPDTRWPGQED